jgi:hypothetical protein
LRTGVFLGKAGFKETFDTLTSEEEVWRICLFTFFLFIPVVVLDTAMGGAKA